MDKIDLCVLLTIVLNNLNKTKLPINCGNSKDSIVSTAAKTFSSSASIPQVRDCKVVLEDISISCGAEKLKMLDLCQEKTHTTEPHHTADSDFLEDLRLKTPIAWGKMIDKRWVQLDEKVYANLHDCATVTESLSLLQETIYNEGANIFGHLQPKPRKLGGQSRRTKLSIQLIKEKNMIKGQISSSSLPDERAALNQLLLITQSKIRSLRKAEKSRKRRWLTKKARNQFKSNPYAAAKNLLDPKSYCSLKIDQETLDKHKFLNLTDKQYDIPLGTLDGLPPPPQLLKKFNKSSFSYDNFLAVLTTRRNASAPGLNGIPYKVYKKCPNICRFLFKIFQTCFKKTVVPVQWRSACEVYIPKITSPSESKISDFRPIALLNVEGKLFFSLVSKRLETHLILSNKFINRSIQKGCMEKVPGCWEHLSMVWLSLKEARAEKSSLSTIWLDIANAYGSIPHKLIIFALKRYGVPPFWIKLIETYYQGIFSKSFSESAKSSWHRHQRGIFQGCTLSIILFLAGMNIIIEYASVAKVPKFIFKNTELPLLRAFMDDLSLMSSTVSGAKHLLSRCITALTWAGLEFRADKSRCIVIIKGRSMNVTPFSISKSKDCLESIPSIHTRPVKFLGRIIDGSISDRNSSIEIQKKLFDGLNIIDNSFFSGVQKLWILQHMLIPRIQWPLLIYEIPLTFAFKLEQKVSVFIRKWLHLYHSTSSLCFYSSESPCPLPIKSITSILKSSKISGHLLLSHSKDHLISNCNPTLQAGTWKVEKAVSSSESDIKLNEICGKPQLGRQGLGYCKATKVPKDKTSKEYRRFIAHHFNHIDDTYAISKAVQLQVQGHWTRWLNYIQQDFSWASLLALPANLTSFCLASTYDTLPSPRNLQRWHITTEANCFLCGKDVCTTAHILGACNISLKQGRFTFRHDNVLNVMVEAIANNIQAIKKAKPVPLETSIKFVKKGTKVPKRKTSPIGILHHSTDWKMSVDLGSNYCFPSHIAFTQLRPDITIFSNLSKRVIIIELTCPCEENMESWHNSKMAKYAPLKTVIEGNGWCVDLFAIEVGARGYCSKSVSCCLKKLGFNNKTIRSTIKDLSKVSMECSFCIWLARNNKEWVSPNPKKPKDFPKETCFSPTNRCAERKSSSTAKITGSLCPVGFVNKGNTCYANSILQVLSVLPSLWNRVPSESNCLSPMLKAISLNMAVKNKATLAVDPSNFLWALKRKISSTSGSPFDFNRQQDAAEILQHVLDELKGISVAASDLISNTQRITITCNTCFCSSVSEESHDIITLPVSSDIQTSFDTFLSPETLTSNNKWFCPSCNAFTDSTRETCITKSAPLLIIQLRRFYNQGPTLLKNEDMFNCTLSEPNRDLSVAVTSDSEISVNNSYSLTATINHSGFINQGHYWAVIRDTKSSNWYCCNDRLVFRVDKGYLNNKTSYILFYRRI